MLWPAKGSNEQMLLISIVHSLLWRAPSPSRNRELISGAQGGACANCCEDRRAEGLVREELISRSSFGYRLHQHC